MRSNPGRGIPTAFALKRLSRKKALAAGIPLSLRSLGKTIMTWRHEKTEVSTHLRFLMPPCHYCLSERPQGERNPSGQCFLSAESFQGKRRWDSSPWVASQPARNDTNNRKKVRAQLASCALTFFLLFVSFRAGCEATQGEESQRRLP